jgi:hypothetical protein
MMSSMAVAPAGSPSPTTTTTSAPPQPVSVSGTATGVSDLINYFGCDGRGYDFVSSGTFDLAYFGQGTYSYRFCTDNLLPSWNLEGTFEFSPSGGGLIRGSISGSQRLAGHIQSSITFTIEEGVGPFEGLSGSLLWEGTHRITATQHTEDSDIVSGSVFVPA